MHSISEDVVEECRLLLFNAHAVVTIAAAAAVSEMPAHPQFMHDALDLAAAWVMESIDRLDEHLSSGAARVAPIRRVRSGR
jgi:hypothetical protein